MMAEGIPADEQITETDLARSYEELTALINSAEKLHFFSDAKFWRRVVEAKRAQDWKDPEPWVTEDGTRQSTSVVPYIFGARTYADYKPRTLAEYRAETEKQS